MFKLVEDNYSGYGRSGYTVYKDKEDIADIEITSNYIMAKQYGTVFYFKSLLGYDHTKDYIEEYCLNEICKKLQQGIDKKDLYTICDINEVYE